ncbi:NUDIX hydrolase N-terminal domain-containing protein [Spirochaeta cellobiosiphila]|uniref:NUDIX hydrolase N-terminal domain-containing protein n=1 Tax=Spirochaeta cellobiosiphila TaxID=504483 RepID=UPI00041618CB|nr:NUDIX hydrolase [Spirochaeta cellobiosiphila]
MSNQPKWLDYAQRLQAIAQAGLAYSPNKYDVERFEELQRISYQMMSEHSDIPFEKVEALFESEAGYPTPKVDVRGAVFHEGKILLVQEQVDQYWSLPGGWADVSHSVKENVIKEAQEEAGAIVVPKRIIAIQDRKRHNKPVYVYSIYKIFVQCDFIEMAFETNTETITADFFGPDELPPLSLTRNTPEQIKMCFEALHSDHIEPFFD